LTVPVFMIGPLATTPCSQDEYNRSAALTAPPWKS
jgi:hypothetical protein